MRIWEKAKERDAHKRRTLLGSAHVVTPDVTHSLGGRWPPSQAWRWTHGVPGGVYLWGPPLTFLSLSLSFSLIFHKARQTKIKLPRREFPSPRAHMPSCSGSTSYFHIRGRNCHGVPHRNSVWPQTPVSSLGAYAIEGERARKKKEVIKVTELRSICRGLVYGNDSRAHTCTHTHIHRRTHAGNAILARKGTYFRIPLCTRICHASGSIQARNYL